MKIFVLSEHSTTENHPAIRCWKLVYPTATLEVRPIAGESEFWPTAKALASNLDDNCIVTLFGIAPCADIAQALGFSEIRWFRDSHSQPLPLVVVPLGARLPGTVEELLSRTDIDIPPGLPSRLIDPVPHELRGKTNVADVWYHPGETLGVRWYGTPYGAWWEWSLRMANDIADSREVLPPVKIAHWVYVDIHGDSTVRDLSGIQSWSIRTFAAHHPGWRLQLWTNVAWAGPRFEDVKLTGLVVVPVTLRSLPFVPQFNCDGADYLRFLALNLQGGVYMDLDTLTVGDFTPQVTSSVLNWWWSATKTMFRTGCLATGRPGGEFSRRLLAHMSGPGFRPGDRGSVERECMRQLKIGCPGVKRIPGGHEVVYPVDFKSWEGVLKRGTIGPSLAESTIQVHFFTGSGDLHFEGHRSLERELSRLDAEDWKTARGTVFDCIRTSMMRASARGLA